MHLQGEDKFAQPAVLAGRWALDQGYHPYLSRTLSSLAKLPAFPSAEEKELIAQLELPVAFDTFGHHTIVDKGFAKQALPEGGLTTGGDEYPLAPLFVRDLCGRIIHTGIMPLLAPPDVPLFPAGCHPLAEGAAWVEEVLFLTYRRLDCSAEPREFLAGEDNLQLRALYAQPSSYPFKLRPDTFYADGWRIPQVARVFAKAAAPVQTQQLAQEFAQRWQSRPANQTYEEFYDQNEGDTWYAQLFEKGCTIIPTLEAYNGVYHISPEYVATEVEPGRVVKGLHEVVERRASTQPVDTIIDVVEPGWVTATSIHPAKVIVSDGSGWVPPAEEQPLLPNLTWPHSRTSPVWGDVWLPTQPHHFAEPAIWDWDANGHFIQVKGPLWDPLHYVYASTAALVKAQRRPLEGQPRLYALPETLKNQFYPVVAQTWFDAINERTAQQRLENPAHPLYGSGIDQVPLMKTVATLGYHPLPLGLEYELEPAHFPNRHPRHRVPACPPHLQSRVVGLAELKIDAQELQRYNVILSETQRAGLAEAENRAERDDFTILTPQQSPVQAKILPCWLPELAQSKLMINIKRLFANKAYRQALQQVATQLGVSTLPGEFYHFREAALAWRRLRYRLFVKYPAIWQKAYVEGLDLATAEIQISTFDADLHAAVKQGRRNLLGVKAVPVPVAGGLSSPVASAKLSHKPRTPQKQVKNGHR
jgi:hypothetical protein